MTKARLIRIVARIATASSEMTRQLVEGVDNPVYCASDASFDAKCYLSGLKAAVELLEEALSDNTN